ncbi:MAG: cellobiose phosphorylase [Bacilli bacterium]|nr:cellobiose phosphorylase [Bacilli bacterium]
MYEEYHACNSCLNRKVSVHTVYGQRHEGVIVDVDQQNVYLDTSGTTSYGQATISNKKAKTSALGFGFGGRQSILTLALFDLLAIALIA